MDLQLISAAESETTVTIGLEKLPNGLINMNTISELTNVLHYIEDESKCKFIVFRGSKECFSRGLDIDNFDSKKIDYDGFRKWEQVLRIIEKINRVTIAAIEGDCFGSAIDLALTCDVRIAATDVRFAHNEIKKGVMPGQAIMQLGKYCGLGRMLELVQTARIYSAAEAIEMGIVNRSYEADKLQEGITETMEKYASFDVSIHLLSRRLAKEAYSVSYEDFLGSYLAAQHRVLSFSAPESRDEAGESEII